MPTIVELPKDEHAVIRDADEVPERLRRAHLEAQGKILDGSDVKVDEDGNPTDIKLGGDAVSIVGKINDALIMAYVKEWTLTAPLTADALLDLPSATYDLLLKACEAAQAQARPVVADPSQAADPASPTAPLVE